MNEREAVYILSAGLVFFSIVVLLVCWLLPQNQALYTTFAAILGNFSGGLFTYLQVKKNP